MSVGEKSVVFLLGAGCSYDASVPISKDMIVKLENCSPLHIKMIYIHFINM